MPYTQVCQSRILKTWELNIVSRLFNDRDGKVFHGVSTLIEVLSHRFQNLLVFDVTSVTIEADVQGILGQTNILFWALPALYHVNCALGLAVSRCVHLVGFLGFGTDRASESICGFDVLAGFAASAVAWPVSILFLFPGTFSDEDTFMNTCCKFFSPNWLSALPIQSS